ncbi:AAA family ATPase [Chitinophaga lutea]
MENNQLLQIVAHANLCDNYYTDCRALYLQSFGKTASVVSVNRVNHVKAFEQLQEKYADRIADVYTYRDYSRQGNKFTFDRMIVVLQDVPLMIEFSHGQTDILHAQEDEALVRELTIFVAAFRQRAERKPHEIHLVVQDRGLRLASMEVRRTKLDLDLYYDDDFAAVDALITQRINKRKGKGLVLLHGQPGTGKTTYLRHLTGKLKKRLLFMPPQLADQLTGPGFIELLMSYPDSVLVIEDAEQVLADRSIGRDSSVSNLLNLTDGLLSDCLNVQVICTFNCPLASVDKALLRKGRLIAQYEFKALPAEKAQRLSAHLGFDTVITRPMTIAEITNQNERTFDMPRAAQIGFRAAVLQA